MKYQIGNGPAFTTLQLTLSRGESVKAEAGAMIGMTSSVSLEAKTSGKGVFGALKAVIGGESLFISLYTASEDNSELLLAPAAPGDIIAFEMIDNTIYAQGGAYLAGSPELEISTQGSLRALISGEGLFLQKISGRGTVFLNSYGAIIKKTLATGETYRVDTGHIVAIEDGVHYQIRKASKGLFSTFASGEGLICEYSGPGSIWIQTRNIPALANILTPFLPKKEN